ncbi:hypothetical protein A0H76_2582 [Hepatospora eriocheir]|uniref:Uncharacterized protein n=1 Tax=Hepatospora eriocheir TaxID=1081669 RepID=A0A1X0QJM4_9MICR|nr:hypothetical protein A0H76_2582 [Hepatospora eriocheir]
MYCLCPGASKMFMTMLLSSIKFDTPNSWVLPLSLSSGLISIHQLKYQDDLFFSSASFLYFSSVLASTILESNNIIPPIVDLPASTCPTKTTLTTGLLFSNFKFLSNNSVNSLLILIKKFSNKMLISILFKLDLNINECDFVIVD